MASAKLETAKFSALGILGYTGTLLGRELKYWQDIEDGTSGTGQIENLTPTDGNFIVGNGTAWVAENGATVRTSLGLGTGDSPSFSALTVRSITHGSSTGQFIVAGGSSITHGGNIVMYGESHTTNAGDTLFRSESNTWLSWDYSALTASLTGSFSVSADILASGLPTYADEAAAVTGGLASNKLYRTSTGEVRIKL